jgi:flagellar P-ring protein precursor FlgI
MRRRIVNILLIAALGLCAMESHAGKTLREISRVRGQGASVVQGLGLVVGLNGTGDSASELVMARPLAETLKNMGNPVPVDDLGKGKSVALVMVSCRIPRDGAKSDDVYDVSVSVLNSAKSLEGGRLLITPLIGPRRERVVYAFAEGELTVPNDEVPTSARVVRGAQMVRDINTTPSIAGTFDIIVDQSFSGMGAAAAISAEINQQYLLTASSLTNTIASAVDGRTIRVVVPETERTRPAAFFGDIMQTDISSALRRLPAQVRCDTSSGVIIITGDVQVSPVVITHKDLSITTIVPPLPGDIGEQTSDFAAVYAGDEQVDTSRLQDLITAFDQLDIPSVEQINILKMLRDSGKLHAKLIIDGRE